MTPQDEPLGPQPGQVAATTEAVRAHNRRVRSATRAVLGTCGVLMVALGVIVILAQITATDRELFGYPHEPDRPVVVPEDCCRGDLAFPLGGLMTAWGLALLVNVALPQRWAEGPRVRLNILGRLGAVMVSALTATPVVLAVQLANWQPTTLPDAAVLPTVLPALAVAATVAAGWWRSLTIAVGSLTIGSPWRTRTITLGPGTVVTHHHDSAGGTDRVSFDDGSTRHSLRVARWGDVDTIGAALHRAVTLSNVPGTDHHLLLIPPRMPLPQVRATSASSGG